MTIDKPFKRNIRLFTDGTFADNGKARYIIHPDYSQTPELYVRGFLLLQKDMQNLFDYVEPADENLTC